MGGKWQRLFGWLWLLDFLVGWWLLWDALASFFWLIWWLLVAMAAVMGYGWGVWVSAYIIKSPTRSNSFFQFFIFWAGI
jgi:hypothetical protein